MPSGTVYSASRGKPAPQRLLHNTVPAACSSAFFIYCHARTTLCKTNVEHIASSERAAIAHHTTARVADNRKAAFEHPLRI